MKPAFVACFALFVVSAILPAETSFDQVVNGAISQENHLLNTLRTTHPLAETYIQELDQDQAGATQPKTDHYFLGTVDFTDGVTTASFIPKAGARTRAFNVFAHLFSMQYLPRGFAQMLLIDGSGFDRSHYSFQFVRREFLGEVRTYVIDVHPLSGAGAGRFFGRIWVEDKDFNIVRFNGVYGPPQHGQFYMHFDSWRVNCGPNEWAPALVYSEESALRYALVRKLRYKAITRVWGYGPRRYGNRGEFTNVVVDMASAQDKSEQSADTSALESTRAWEHESEDNVIERMEKSAMLAPQGEVDKVLDTVVNNLVVTNNLSIEPEVRTRVLMTAPLETFTVGHTIVISRGLIDTLPDEASLAAFLAHELAHIALGHSFDTKFAFSDRVQFDDGSLVRTFHMKRTDEEEQQANARAMQLLKNSPYSDKLSQAGLFLRALADESDRVPMLVRPLFGGRLADRGEILRMAALMEGAPALDKDRADQIAALPLGSRTKLDPWTDELQLSHTRAPAPLSAREKMPFEVTPVFLNLKRMADVTPDQQPGTR